MLVDFARLRTYPDRVETYNLHVRALLSFQQPTFQKSQNIKVSSAAPVVVSFVSSEIRKCRSLK